MVLYGLIDVKFRRVDFIAVSKTSWRVHSIVTSVFMPEVGEVAGKLFPAFIADEHNAACLPVEAKIGLAIQLYFVGDWGSSALIKTHYTHNLT